MLKQRVITGVSLLLVLGGGLLILPYQGLLLMLMGIFLIGAWEWADLSGLRQSPSRIAYLTLMVALMVALVGYCGLLEEGNR